MFEEQGVPQALFHGGFGMVAAGCIPKPTFWTFYFYKQLKRFGQECVYRDEDAVIVRNAQGYAGILWNIDEEDRNVALSFAGAGQDAAAYTLVTRTVDEICCNPLKLWHDLGEPAIPTEEETRLIKDGAWPLTESDIITAADGNANLSILVRRNGVVYFTLTRRSYTPDRGYDYD